MKPECNTCIFENFLNLLITGVQKRKHSGKRSRESKSRSVSPGADIFENKAFLENFQKVQDTNCSVLDELITVNKGITVGSTAPVWSVSSQSTNSEITDPVSIIIFNYQLVLKLTS